MRVQLIQRKATELNHELIWGAIGLAIGLAALIVPFERLGFRCLLKATTGGPCPTCGMTRSLVRLRHFDIAGGFVANPLIAALALFAVLYCAYATLAVVFDTRRIRIALTRPWEPWLIRILVLAALLGNWIYLVLVGR